MPDPIEVILDDIAQQLRRCADALEKQVEQNAPAVEINQMNLKALEAARNGGILQATLVPPNSGRRTIS